MIPMKNVFEGILMKTLSCHAGAVHTSSQWATVNMMALLGSSLWFESLFEPLCTPIEAVLECKGCVLCLP